MCISVYVSARLDVFVFVCLCLCVYVFGRVCVCVCVCACECVCVCASAHVCGPVGPAASHRNQILTLQIMKRSAARRLKHRPLLLEGRGG